MKLLNTNKDKREITQWKKKILVKAKYEMYSTPFHICSFFKRQAGLAF